MFWNFDIFQCIRNVHCSQRWCHPTCQHGPKKIQQKRNDARDMKLCVIWMKVWKSGSPPTTPAGDWFCFKIPDFWVPFVCKPSQFIGYPSFDPPEQWKHLIDLRHPVAEQSAEMCRCHQRTIWNSILACVSTKSRNSANLSNSFVRFRLQRPNRGTRQDGIFPWLPCSPDLQWTQ